MAFADPGPTAAGAGGEPATHIAARLAAGRRVERPFRHWLLSDVLPPALAEGVGGLPFAPPDIGDTLGRRETHNSTRVFFAPEERQRFPLCAAVAGAFQHPGVVAQLEAGCGIELGGSYLRLEYCQDRDGFWLEPHTDIAAKRFTMLVYLSTGPEAAGWGTDLYDAVLEPVGTAPADFNCGLIFIPGTDSWHGFRRRPIRGIRRSLIVNYVTPEWRARHELAFPGRPVPLSPAANPASAVLAP